MIVFLWGFTAILGKLIHANAEVLVFYRMLFAAGFLYVFIRFIKKIFLFHIIIPPDFLVKLLIF